MNTKFFYEAERDGPGYIPNVLRSAPGHLNDQHAAVYQTPPLDSNDNIATAGKSLTSYTVALQEIGVRDFRTKWGRMLQLILPRRRIPFLTLETHPDLL